MARKHVNVVLKSDLNLKYGPKMAVAHSGKGKGVLKICSKFTGEYPCRSVISIKLKSNFIEIILRQGYSPVNLLHIFRTPFLKNTSGGLLL